VRFADACFTSVGGMLNCNPPGTIKRVPKIGIVRPLHLHPPVWFQDREQRDEIGFEAVVMHRIGLAPNRRSDFKPRETNPPRCSPSKIIMSSPKYPSVGSILMVRVPMLRERVFEHLFR